jgi:hypothetical protein
MIGRTLLVAGLLGWAVLLLLPASAMADTVVPAGRSVVEVTVVGEDVILNGTSQGSVIVIDGNLTIGPRGRAGHGVTLIGGRLTTVPGARINGDVFQLVEPIPHPSGWGLAGVGAALLAARFLVVWVMVRIARILASRPTTATMLAASRRRPIRSAAVGALLAAGLLAAGILLALSVVGLIFSAALAGVLLLAAALGVAFALHSIRDDREHATTIIVALAVPLIGDALLALASIVALGAAFHYLVDERSARTRPIPMGS